MAEWIKKKLKDIVDFNPRESIAKGAVAKKVAMDKLQPFCRDIPEYELEPFYGGTKFRNGDTIMARITPCLENGKIAKVSVLDDGEVGFGSTEYIVFRAKHDIDEDFVYYLICSPYVRESAIKSMVGTSGRQRVQTEVVQNLDIWVPSNEEQQRISVLLKSLDDKIAANTEINKNLHEQIEALFKERFLSHDSLPFGWTQMTLGEVSEICAGGDKPQIISNHKTEVCQYPVYSNGISNEGIYGFTTDYKISSESVTVSARGTIGYVCLRHIPYTPIVRLVTLIPHENILSTKYLYLWLKSIPIHGTGTTQQQLTVPDFRNTEIIIPPEADMREFTELVNPLFHQMWSNQDENEKLAELRAELLPRLMSGELDMSSINL